LIMGALLPAGCCGEYATGVDAGAHHAGRVEDEKRWSGGAVGGRASSAAWKESPRSSPLPSPSPLPPAAAAAAAEACVDCDCCSAEGETRPTVESLRAAAMELKVQVRSMRAVSPDAARAKQAQMVKLLRELAEREAEVSGPHVPPIAVEMSTNEQKRQELAERAIVAAATAAISESERAQIAATVAKANAIDRRASKVRTTEAATRIAAAAAEAGGLVLVAEDEAKEVVDLDQPTAQQNEILEI